MEENDVSRALAQERRAALAEMYREYRGDLRSFLLALLRDGAEAEDALQEVFLQLLEHWEAIDPQKSRSWLYTVAYRTAMGVHRRKGRDRISREKLLRRPVWDRSRAEAPEDRTLQRESVEAVRSAIERLPQEQREVVRRRIYDEQTFADIAQELRCPLGTVLTRMRLAVGRLRQWIDR